MVTEEELGGDERSEYGLEVIKKISKELTQRYGKGYDRSNLYHCLKFYKTFPEIVDTACRQSGILLSWSHYRTLLQVKDLEARDWYEKEAAEQIWSVRTLQRNISSQYYYRMLGTQKKEFVESEMKELTTKDVDIVVYLVCNGKQLSESIPADGCSSFLNVTDKEYKVGGHADVDENTNVKVVVYDGKKTEPHIK